MPSIFPLGSLVALTAVTSEIRQTLPVGTVGIVSAVAPVERTTPDCGVDFDGFAEIRRPTPYFNRLNGSLPISSGRFVSDADLRLATADDFPALEGVTGMQVGDIIALNRAVLSAPANTLGIIVRTNSEYSSAVYFPGFNGGHNLSGAIPSSNCGLHCNAPDIRVVRRMGVAFGQKVINLEAMRIRHVAASSFRGVEIGDRITTVAHIEGIPTGSTGTVVSVPNSMNRIAVVLDEGHEVGNNLGGLLPDGSHRGVRLNTSSIRVVSRDGISGAAQAVRSANPAFVLTTDPARRIPMGATIRVARAAPGRRPQDAIPLPALSSGHYIRVSENSGMFPTNAEISDYTHHLIDFGPGYIGLNNGSTSGQPLSGSNGYNIPSYMLETQVNGIWYPIQLVLASTGLYQQMLEAVIEMADTYPDPFTQAPVTIDTFMDSMRSGLPPVRPSSIRPAATRRTSVTGRRVVVVQTNEDEHHAGVREGYEGVIISDSSNYSYVVNFEDNPLRGGRDNCTMRKEHVELLDPNAPPKEVPAVNVGDRVVMRRDSKEGPPVDTEGTVLRVTSREVDVDFYPYRWRYGQDLGSGNERSCRRVTRNSISVLKEPEIKALKAFFLVTMKGGKPVPVPDDPGYDDGKAAADAAKKLSEKMGVKVQTRKSAPPDAKWREREALRIADGTYKPLPKAWTLKPIPDHFLHLAVKNPGMVSYTPSEDYGAQDRQVFTRPGSYVQRFYPDLSKNDIARFSAIAACDGQLEITTSSEEMVRIYRLGAEGKGPDSCMKYDFKAGHSGINLPIHPIEVYGEGELALAFLRQGEDKIIARCLIWPEKKIFTRAYGDIAKIYAILEAEGYKRDNFYEAKIKRQTLKRSGSGDIYVVPYIDDCNSVQGNPKALAVVDDGKNLIIKPVEQGQSAAATSGYIAIEKMWRLHERGPVSTCGHCGAEDSKSDMTNVIVDVVEGSGPVRQSWCRRCVRNHSFTCVGFGERVTNSISRLQSGLHGGDYVSNAYVQLQQGYTCAASGMAFWGTRTTAIPKVLKTGEKVSSEYFGAYCFTCAGSGENLWRLDRRTGKDNFTVIKGEMYSNDYVKDHPELKNNTAGITATEKSAKPKKKVSPSDISGIGLPPIGYTATPSSSSTTGWQTYTLRNPAFGADSVRAYPVSEDARETARAIEDALAVPMPTDLDDL